MFRLLFLCMLISITSFSYAKTAQTLSLEEAILLAIRENPNVQRAQLSHVQQKYSLDVAHWQFKPHYSLSARNDRARMTPQLEQSPAAAESPS